MQPHYNLLNREEEREMLPLCEEEGIGVIPWSPLARGRLARAWQSASSSNRTSTDETARNLYTRFEDSDKSIVERVGVIAKARNISYARVSLAWLLQQPLVTSPIIGATKIEHLEDAVATLQVHLNNEELEALTAEYIPHPIVGYK